MGLFGKLFSGKQQPPRTNLDSFKDGPTFLGSVIVLQFMPEDRLILPRDDIQTLLQEFSPKLQSLVELWVNAYVAWLLHLLAKAKFGEDYARAVMFEVYGRIGSNEDRVRGISSIADGIRFWFREFDDGVQDAIKNPLVFKGQELPAVYGLALRLLARDDSSPFFGNAKAEFGNTDVLLASAFENAQELSKPRIDFLLDRAAAMPR